jgi:hypothetical protein
MTPPPSNSSFRNRSSFERNVLVRQYGYNNATTDVPYQQGGFNSSYESSSQSIRNPTGGWSNMGRGRRGSGGRKIICTKLYELGLLSKKIFEADQKFGKKLSQQNPEVYYGYIAWAKTVVDWMNGKGPQCMFWIKDKKKRNKAQKELSIKWAKAIATPWAKHMAYLMGVEKKDNLAGKVIMALGKPICKVVGRWQTIFGKSKKPAGLIQGYSLWLLFAIFRLITLVIKK